MDGLREVALADLFIRLYSSTFHLAFWRSKSSIYSHCLRLLLLSHLLLLF